MPVHRQKKDTTPPTPGSTQEQPSHRYLTSRPSSSIYANWRERPCAWCWRE